MKDTGGQIWLTLALLQCSLLVGTTGAVLARHRDVDQFLSGKTDVLKGFDTDGPFIHNYRTAPTNDPGFRIPTGPAVKRVIRPASGAPAIGKVQDVDDFRNGKSDVLRGFDGTPRYGPQTHIVNDGPIVHAYRKAPLNAPGFQIPVGPAGPNNGHIPNGGIPLGGNAAPMPSTEGNTLPQSGFGQATLHSKDQSTDVSSKRDTFSQPGQCLDRSMDDKQTEIENFAKGRSKELRGYDAEQNF